MSYDPFPCPHCGGPSLVPGTSHVCPDKDRWTRAERDAWRAEARRRFPALQFVAGSATARSAA